METVEILIVAVAAVIIVCVVAITHLRTRQVELEAAEQRAVQQAEDRAAARLEEIARKLEAPRVVRRGPLDGARVAVHVGSGLVQGTRVMRETPEAEGFVVLKDAELHEGNRSSPLGGLQWLPADAWLQEMS